MKEREIIGRRGFIILGLLGASAIGLSWMGKDQLSNISLKSIQTQDQTEPPPESSNGQAEPREIYSEAEEIEIILTGDVMLGRTVMAKSLELNDPSYPFRQVAETLRAADLVFVNLENPLVFGCPTVLDGENLILCADPKMAEGLTSAGIDVATLANNHNHDWGEEGLNQTARILRERGILVTGLGELVTKLVGDTKFGFLGFDFFSHSPQQSDFEAVASADSLVDVLIVGVHWGNEYQEQASSYQAEWARKLVESGADVVVGHHPHVVQNWEEIDGVPVYYSLGNFIFDQMWDDKVRQGLAIRLTFRGNKLVRTQLLPTYMNSWAQPEFKDDDLP